MALRTACRGLLFDFDFLDGLATLGADTESIKYCTNKNRDDRDNDEKKSSSLLRSCMQYSITYKYTKSRLWRQRNRGIVKSGTIKCNAVSRYYRIPCLKVEHSNSILIILRTPVLHLCARVCMCMRTCSQGGNTQDACKCTNRLC